MIWVLVFIVPAVSLGYGLLEDLRFAMSARPVEMTVLSKGVEREEIVLVGGARPDTVQTRLVPWAKVAVAGDRGGMGGPVECWVRGQRALWGDPDLHGTAEIEKRLTALTQAPVRVYMHTVDGVTRCQVSRALNTGVAWIWLACVATVVGFLVATATAVYKQYMKEPQS